MSLVLTTLETNDMNRLNRARLHTDSGNCMIPKITKINLSQSFPVLQHMDLVIQTQRIVMT